jgi:hypothetical protein
LLLSAHIVVLIELVILRADSVVDDGARFSGWVV